MHGPINIKWLFYCHLTTYLCLWVRHIPGHLPAHRIGSMWPYTSPVIRLCRVSFLSCPWAPQICRIESLHLPVLRVTAVMFRNTLKGTLYTVKVREQVSAAVTLVEFESGLVPGHFVCVSVSSRIFDVVAWSGHFRIVLYPSRLPFTVTLPMTLHALWHRQLRKWNFK